MADQWPPPAPNVNQQFKKAHDARNDNVPVKPDSEIVSIHEIQRLEEQRKKSTPTLVMKPPGITTTTDLSAEQIREERIKKMKERLQQNKGKARDDFNQAREL